MQSEPFTDIHLTSKVTWKLVCNLSTNQERTPGESTIYTQPAYHWAVKVCFNKMWWGVQISLYISGTLPVFGNAKIGKQPNEMPDHLKIPKTTKHHDRHHHHQVLVHQAGMANTHKLINSQISFCNTNMRDRKLNENLESLQSQSKKLPGVLCNNYNRDWTAFSHPDVMTVCVKNFVISCITYTSCTRKNEAKNFAIPYTAYTSIYSNSAQHNVSTNGFFQALAQCCMKNYDLNSF